MNDRKIFLVLDTKTMKEKENNHVTFSWIEKYLCVQYGFKCYTEFIPDNKCADEGQHFIWHTEGRTKRWGLWEI